jgi:1-phosphofructokinase family hexose kinase
MIVTKTAPTIVTVTLNPALDRTLSVPQLLPGAIHRARLVRQDWGGKGINVSRTLRNLGIASRVVALLGGVTGELLHNRLQQEGFDVAAIPAGGETRQNITLRDDSSGLYTKLNEPGPVMAVQDEVAISAFIEQRVQPGDIWVFSGSLPAGASADLYARLIAVVQQRNAYAVLDTSGAALRLGLAAQPLLIKPNGDEAAEALGVAIAGDDEHSAAALALHEHGVRYVLLTCGAQGAWLAGDGAGLS